MLNFLKKKEIDVFAPTTGAVVALEKVPDKVFATKMMGEGIAFELKDDEICAPINGKITMIPDTKHAVGITAKNGLEVLIHIGLDTVKQNGEGFTKLLNAGDQVRVGMPIIKVDRAELEKKGYNLITPMIVTNSDEYQISYSKVNEVTSGSSVVFICSLK